jgi:putative transposase
LAIGITSFVLTKLEVLVSLQFLSIPPKISVASFMGYLKGKSSLMMFDRHANLKYKFGNRHFWSEGYYVSTVGLNDATVKKYIRDQERADILQDKMSVKEYEDPFGAKPGKDPQERT